MVHRDYDRLVDRSPHIEPAAFAAQMKFNA
jgi:hypothetical protein